MTRQKCPKLCMGMMILIKNYFVNLKDTIITRGQSKVLIWNHCRLDVQKYAFSHRIVNLLNKLLDSYKREHV